MQRIQGENKGHSVFPKPEDLAGNAQLALTRMLKERPTTCAIITENTTVDALSKFRNGWWTTRVQKCHSYKGITVYRSRRTGHIIISSRSLFQAFADNATNDVRVLAVQEFLHFLQLLKATGNVPAERHSEVQEFERMLLSYVMDWRDFLTT